MARIAWIGLGAMGGRMARRLLDAGHQLTVYNRSPERAEPLAAAGAAVAGSPADAARDADVVFTMVTNPEALRAVIGGEDGVAAGIRPGAAVIDSSTVGPAEVARIPASLPPGTGVLDAPVLGSTGEAESGELKLFVGGPAELAERWTPVLEVLGTPQHVGELGAGAAAKLVANSTLFGTLAVLGEAVALGEGLGLSRETLLEVLAVTPIGGQVERRRAVLESIDDPEVRFTLALARKDAGLVTAAAEEAGRELRAAASAERWLADAVEAGHGEDDYSVVLRTIVERRR